MFAGKSRADLERQAALDRALAHADAQARRRATEREAPPPPPALRRAEMRGEHTMRIERLRAQDGNAITPTRRPGAPSTAPVQPARSFTGQHGRREARAATAAAAAVAPQSPRSSDAPHASATQATSSNRRPASHRLEYVDLSSPPSTPTARRVNPATPGSRRRPVDLSSPPATPSLRNVNQATPGSSERPIVLSDSPPGFDNEMHEASASPGLPANRLDIGHQEVVFEGITYHMPVAVHVFASDRTIGGFSIGIPWYDDANVNIPEPARRLLPAQSTMHVDRLNPGFQLAEWLLPRTIGQGIAIRRSTIHDNFLFHYHGYNTRRERR